MLQVMEIPALYSGEVHMLRGPVYHCRIRDPDGRIRSFFMHGLKEITGKMFHTLTGRQLCDMFPNYPDNGRLAVTKDVDFMIRMQFVNWQPERKYRAGFGGDLWIWENNYRSCLGESHPWVGESLWRSE